MRIAIGASQRCLAEVLTTLVPLLDPASAQEVDSSTAARVPGVLVARLRREHRGDLPCYLEDLQRVAQHLQPGISKLTNRDLGLLDQLAAVADAETSSVFRRMMRT